MQLRAVVELFSAAIYITCLPYTETYFPYILPKMSKMYSTPMKPNSTCIFQPLIFQPIFEGRTNKIWTARLACWKEPEASPALLELKTKWQQKGIQQHWSSKNKIVLKACRPGFWWPLKWIKKEENITNKLQSIYIHHIKIRGR